MDSTKERKIAMQLRLKRCDICGGSKHMLGIGGMQENCYYCKGSGVMEYEHYDTQSTHLYSSIPQHQDEPGIPPKIKKNKGKIKNNKRIVPEELGYIL